MIIIIHSKCISNPLCICICTAGFLGLYNYTIFTYSAECVVALSHIDTLYDVCKLQCDS